MRLLWFWTTLHRSDSCVLLSHVTDSPLRPLSVCTSLRLKDKWTKYRNPLKELKEIISHVRRVDSLLLLFWRVSKNTSKLSSNFHEQCIIYHRDSRCWLGSQVLILEGRTTHKVVLRVQRNVNNHHRRLYYRTPLLASQEIQIGHTEDFV